MKFKNLPALVWLGVALVVVGGLLWTTREGFVPEVDRTQDNRTRALEDSSYAQVTNNFKPTPSDGYPSIPGAPGKDQVNQFQAYVV